MSTTTEAAKLNSQDYNNVHSSLPASAAGQDIGKDGDTSADDDMLVFERFFDDDDFDFKVDVHQLRPR